MDGTHSDSRPGTKWTFLAHRSEERMERDVAIRIDGMTISVRAALDGLSHYLKSNLSPEEYSETVRHVGSAMGELVCLSALLHSRFPSLLRN
jgi:hypothetical protein